MRDVLELVSRYINKVIIKFFFFQAEDGIRDAQESRGLGDVYKRQVNWPALPFAMLKNIVPDFPLCNKSFNQSYSGNDLSLIHI